MAIAQVPRNFKLLAELEKGETGMGAGKPVRLWAVMFLLTEHAVGACSYGLEDPEDIFMTNWRGTIWGPPHVCLLVSACLASFPRASLTHSGQGNHENRIYELKMHCGQKYPQEPPVIHFVSQINLPGVGHHDGLVDKNAIGILRDWEAIAAQLSKNPRPREDPLSLEAALIAIRKSVCPLPAGGWHDVKANQGPKT